MKVNQDTVIIGKNVVLVPYRAEHVPKYHEWMCDEELRLLTASEPLSLEEEFDMQQKWLVDEDKLTFIVLARDDTTTMSQEQIEEASNLDCTVSPEDPYIRSLRMIGDVNLFLHGQIPNALTPFTMRAPDVSREDADDNDFEAELEIMIAEPAYRRKGLALETLQLMLRYATGAPSTYFGAPTASHDKPSSVSSLHIPPESLVTRITESNTPSIRLFEKLGFQVTKRVEVFKEVEMRWSRHHSPAGVLKS
ncbi:N-acetyltransferase 9 [Hypsizygus marmoreus]|uniref:N-acetyltransferase 9 n=1 Tax=Hypsizygus marmoreus TaxID=39966 RepID=A0A369KBH1_HYPMA|nr:N-acetyltransferase 9 [Hypsizygus marmoreus]